ncbi:MAG: BTAD domain-containing putative transcriptional regulator [Planctomycetota bacterium]
MLGFLNDLFDAAATVDANCLAVSVPAHAARQTKRLPGPSPQPTCGVCIVRRGQLAEGIESVSDLDITPTILACTGVPASFEMSGRPILAHRDPLPEPVFTHTDGRGDANHEPHPHAERESMSKLREAGYILADDPLDEVRNRTSISRALLHVAMTELADHRFDEAATALVRLDDRDRTVQSETIRGMAAVQAGRNDDVAAVVSFFDAHNVTSDLLTIARAVIDSDDERAASALKQAAQAHNSAASTLPAPEVGTLAAAAARRRKLHEVARDILRDVTQRFPNASSAWADLSRAERAAHDNERALAAAETSVRSATTSSETADALFAFGVAQLAVGDGNAAVDNLRRSLELEPTREAVGRALAEALRSIGRHEEAIDLGLSSPPSRDAPRL